MDVGFIVPYLLLLLVLLDEHYALWFVFFFVVPLVDVLFYVEIPDKTVKEEYWTRLCMKMWFPLVVYLSLFSECSYQSMISMGILYNSSLCLSDEFEKSSVGVHIMLSRMISDYLGFVCFDDWVSIVRSVLFQYVMITRHRLMWHLGAVFISSLLYEYIGWAENQFYYNQEVSHYGVANYAMFRLKHSNGQLLPISHMWVFPYLQLKKIGDNLKIE